MGIETGRITVNNKTTLGNIPKSELQVACRVKEILGWEEPEAEWKSGNSFPWVDRKYFPFPRVR